MQPTPKHRRAVTLWLTITAALIVLMILIGGLTRLTESGLSIVEWKLLDGIFPPMNDEAWHVEFSAYKTSPEYLLVNKGFELGDFKRIFWLEYLHRVLGRIIGLALVLPFIYFVVRRALPKPLMRRMAFACVLVALQGTVGWVMVASGLEAQPRVDPLKLATHLSLALALLMLLLWTRWQVTGKRPTPHMHRGGSMRLLLALVCAQIVLGAIVAGLDAGYSYNTFPLMDGHWIPPELHLQSPWWLNHLENIRTVQFQHRAGAWLLFFFALLVAAFHWRHALAEQRVYLRALVVVVGLQFCLGVATLLSGMHIAIASAHQLGAVLLLSVSLRLLWLYPCTKRAK